MITIFRKLKHIDNVENTIRRSIPGFIRNPLVSRAGRHPVPGGQCPVPKRKTLLHTLGHDACYGYYLTNTEMENALWNILIPA